MQSDAAGAGAVDWLSRWGAMVADERAQTRAAVGEAGEGQDRWAGQAARYADATGRPAQPDAFLRLVLPHLRPDDTLLDVGAGAGRHATFLAGQVRRVVAVERSAAMRAQLERRVAELGLANLEIIAAAWPECAAPPADVAICAHVIYGVAEVGPFLRALDAHARRACFILAGLRQPSAALSPFWERLYGQPRLPLPGALECLCALHQLGIPAQLALIPASRYTFADAQEALADIRWRLRLAPGPESDARILAAMGDLLEREPDGRLAPRGQPAHSAVIWWQRG